jgi:outer membrane protein assembly factor BamB
MKEATAEKIWEIDMVKDLGGDTIRWGYNETPVIDGNLIYCTPGGKNSVVALDRSNGKLIWSCPGKGELSAYCTPLLLIHNGRKILATHTESHLLGIDAKSGKLLWAHPHPNQWSVHANTPIYHDGGLFFFSGYGKGSGKLVLNEDGSSVKLAWNSVMDSRMGGAVLIDGYIYGSGDNAREWRSINWNTGKDGYASSEIGKGVTIAADGKLICYSDKGELALANANPTKFDLVSKTRVTKGSEQHWAHPVINNGVLYLRHGKALIAYKIK